MSRKGKKDYPVELKLEAIRLSEIEGYSQKEITQMLGIRDPEAVRKWLLKYRKEGEAGFNKVRRGRPKKDPNNKDEIIKHLKMEVALLKALAIELGEELPEGLDTGSFTNTESNSI